MSFEDRSFLLRPYQEQRSREQFIAYTESWQRPAALEPRARFHPWSGDDPPSSSVPSAVAGKAAEAFGEEASRAYSLRLFEAYFGENRTISERSVLVEVAERAGIPPEEFERVLDEREEELLAEVVAEHNQAIESGIRGVPAVVVDHRYLISGAVPTDHYRQAIEQVANQRRET